MTISSERLAIMEKTGSQDVRDLVHEVEALNAKINRVREDCIEGAQIAFATLSYHGWWGLNDGYASWYQSQLAALVRIQELIEKEPDEPQG